MLLLAVVAAACAGRAGERARTSDTDQLVVASFDFPESALVAEIYAHALEAVGVPVRRELGLGPRELVSPALRQGLVDVVPDYLGSALTGLTSEPVGDDLGTAGVRARLAAALAPWDVDVLEPAPAENRNELVVTAAFAARHDTVRVSDLVHLADRLTFAGPAECRDRRQCLRGLEEVYGLRFDAFTPIQGSAQARRALEEDVAQVAVMFTTDGLLAEPGLLALVDDQGLQPVENLVPLVRRDARARHGEVVAMTLNRVSARLAVTDLRFLNWRVTVAGGEPSVEARGWLVRQGLIDR